MGSATGWPRFVARRAARVVPLLGSADSDAETLKMASAKWFAGHFDSLRPHTLRLSCVAPGSRLSPGFVTSAPRSLSCTIPESHRDYPSLSSLPCLCRRQGASTCWPRWSRGGRSRFVRGSLHRLWFFQIGRGAVALSLVISIGNIPSCNWRSVSITHSSPNPTWTIRPMIGFAMRVGTLFEPGLRHLPGFGRIAASMGGVLT